MPQEQAYGTPPPNPYGTPVFPGAYAAPPPPPTPYGGQYAPAPGSFIPPPDQPPRRQGPNVGLIIGIVALVVLLVAGGIIALLATRNNPQTNTNRPTVTTSYDYIIANNADNPGSDTHSTAGSITIRLTGGSHSGSDYNQSTNSQCCR